MIVIRNTVKQKIPLRSVLLMLTTVTLLTIIGSRLFTIPAGDWGKVISTGSLAGYTGRSAIGGLLFGLAGLVFSKRFLGLGMPGHKYLCMADSPWFRNSANRLLFQRMLFRQTISSSMECAISYRDKCSLLSMGSRVDRRKCRLFP